MRQESVWIAFTDAPDEPEAILGVFGTQQGASDFLDEVMSEFPEHSLLYGEYRIGWRFDQGAERYRSTERAGTRTPAISGFPDGP